MIPPEDKHFPTCEQDGCIVCESLIADMSEWVDAIYLIVQAERYSPSDARENAELSAFN